MVHFASSPRTELRLPRTGLRLPTEHVRLHYEMQCVHMERLPLSLAATNNLFVVNSESCPVGLVNVDMRVVNGALRCVSRLIVRSKWGVARVQLAQAPFTLHPALFAQRTPHLPYECLRAHRERLPLRLLPTNNRFVVYSGSGAGR